MPIDPVAGPALPQWALPNQAGGFFGNMLGLGDAWKALQGQMTPEEAQQFALGAIPMLMGGPETKVAQEAAPAIAQGIRDVAPAVTQGIRAFHGSPYDFNQFDLSKIGTGEGAQAYGHGLYFAGNEQTAKTYRDSLSDLTPGKMYEVNINADPEHFLDWDKPLSEQHPKVQGALKQIMPQLDEHAALSNEGFDWGNSGEQIGPEAAQFMRDAGIPGIKYLDQGSRGSGQGTSNYVVFNDKLIDIMRKYGLAPLIAGPTAGALMQGNGNDAR